MKKWMTVILAVCSICASISACSGSEAVMESTEKAAEAGNSENRENTESVKITYLSRYTNPEDKRAKYFMDRLEEFKQQNPEIEIEDISVTDADAYISKMKSLIAAGAVPDVFACSYEMPRYDLAKNGVIANIEEMISSDDWTGPTDEKFFVGYEFKDQGLDGIYGVPNNLATIQMFVNTRLLEEQGLSVPETWEDIEKMAPQLIENGITPVGLSAKNKPKCIQFFTMLGVKMYGMDFQKKFVDKTIDWNDPEVMDVLNQFKTYVDQGIFGPDAISYAFDNVLSNFEQGKIAVVFEMSYQFARFETMENSKDIKCINVLGFEDKPEYWDIWFTDYFDALCIGAKQGTKEYEAAVKLYSFMLSQETFNQYAEVMGGGAYPLEVEFDQSKVGNVMADFMEAYKSCTDITAILTAYCNDPVIADLTQSELQTLFVGRSAEDIAATLNEEYAKAFKK